MGLCSYHGVLFASEPTNKKARRCKNWKPRGACRRTEALGERGVTGAVHARKTRPTHEGMTFTTSPARTRLLNRLPISLRPNLRFVHFCDPRASSWTLLAATSTGTHANSGA